MIQRLAFLGVRASSPDAFAATVGLYRELLGLEPFLEDETSVRFRAADGARSTSTDRPTRPRLLRRGSRGRAGGGRLRRGPGEDGRGGDRVRGRAAAGGQLGLEPLPGARRQCLRDHGPGRRRWLTRPRSPPRSCSARSGCWRTGRPSGAGRSRPAVRGVRHRAAVAPGDCPHRADPRRQVARAGADPSAGRRGHHLAGRGGADRRVLDPVDDDPVHRQQHHEHRRSRGSDRRHRTGRAATLRRRALAEAPHGPGQGPGVVGADRCDRGVRGRPVRCVQRRGAGRGP